VAEYLWDVANANMSVSRGRATVAVKSHENMLHYMPHTSCTFNNY